MTKIVCIDNPYAMEFPQRMNHKSQAKIVKTQGLINRDNLNSKSKVNKMNKTYFKAQKIDF